MKTLVMLTITLAASILGTAQAASPTSPATMVRFGDLDLGTTAGSAALLKRLRSAAELVCSSARPLSIVDPATGFVKALLRLHEACMHNAIDRAVAAIGSPEFNAYVASYPAPKEQFSQISQR